MTIFILKVLGSLLVFSLTIYFLFADEVAGDVARICCFLLGAGILITAIWGMI